VNRTAELRLLQAIAALACLVPLTAGTLGVVRGAAFSAGRMTAITPNLDSHFRYLSGIFLGVGIAFVHAVLGLERRGPLFRMLGGFVILGGCARLLSLIQIGQPNAGNVFGLCMELGVVPALMLWQWRVERRFRR
jgi:hypothetical protein